MKKKSSDTAGAPAEDRRGFVASVAAVATGMAVAATGVRAQTRAPGRLPPNTPIGKLGFNAAELAMMTPATQALTKQQLIELQEWARKGDVAGAPEHLTLKDVSSLEAAYAAMNSRQHAAGATAQDVTACCCCCPCCSCTAAADVQTGRTA
jgi:hypothetical protein